MKITLDDVFALWKIRSTLLSTRKPRWIWQSFYIPLIMLIVPAMLTNFNRKIMGWFGVGYVCFLVIASIILIGLYRLKGRSHREFSYQASILLYIIYDLASAGFFTASFLVWSMLILQSMAGENFQLYQSINDCILLFFGIVAVLTLLFSPWLLIQKIKWMANQGKYNKHLPLALAISIAMPGIGLLISSLLFRIGNLSAEGYFSASWLLILALGLLIFTLTGIYEIVLFSLNEWPEIHKVKSEYMVTRRVRAQDK